jgi:ABC-type multidrug transport system fused ATPase/permease subunit
LTPFADWLSRILPISDYKHKLLQADLERLELEITPQQYIGKSIAQSLLMSFIGLAFVPLGVPLLSLLIMVAALLAYFRSTQSIRQKVSKLNKEIEAELPRMVESLIYSLQDNRDLISFFEHYRKVSGQALAKELDRLILLMKIGNHELALRQFEARLAIPQLSALVSILCGVHQGVDQKTSLLILEQDIRTKQRETMRREMEKRPGRIKAASFILTVLMILMFMVPLVLMILSNLKTAGF